MTALDLWAVREAVAGALASVVGARVLPYMPDNPPTGTVLLVAVLPGDEEFYVSYFETFGPGTLGHLADVSLRLLVVSTTEDPRSAQMRLDAALSSGAGMDGSVIDALCVDRTLGGVVDECVPLRARAPALWVFEDGHRFWAAEVPLMIRLRRR